MFERAGSGAGDLGVSPESATHNLHDLEQELSFSFTLDIYRMVVMSSTK